MPARYLHPEPLEVEVENAKAVKFNDGTHDSVYALVIGQAPEDHNTLDLAVLRANGIEIAEGIPKRDPSDYGAEGGGRTWHD